MPLPESAYCLDRKVTLTNGTSDGTTTTWALPYSVAVAGAQGTLVAVRQDTGESITVTRPTATTVRADGVLLGVPVVVGVSYDCRITPSDLGVRGDDGQPDMRARCVVGRLRLQLDNTRVLSATVTTTGRAAVTVIWDGAADQQFHVPVCAESTRADLVFHTDSPFPVLLGSFEWDGQVSPTTTRRLTP